MALPSLSLSLQFGDLKDAARHRAALPRHTVIRCIRHALEADAEITVRIVDADEGQALNRDYRSKDYATNVLTFDYATEPVVMADLVLCAPVVADKLERAVIYGLILAIILGMKAKDYWTVGIPVFRAAIPIILFIVSLGGIVLNHFRYFFTSRLILFVSWTALITGFPIWA